MNKGRNFVKRVIHSCDNVEQLETARAWLECLYQRGDLSENGWKAVNLEIRLKNLNLLPEDDWIPKSLPLEQNIAEN